MFSTKPGSIGDIPPSTRRSAGRSAFTALAASFTMSPKMVQPGSISKFQWDRLFGSFQNITASTIRRSPAHVDLFFGMVENLEPGAAQHGFRAGAVGNPPVGGIV